MLQMAPELQTMLMTHPEVEAHKLEAAFENLTLLSLG